jgi:hypothetical protein
MAYSYSQLKFCLRFPTAEQANTWFVEATLLFKEDRDKHVIFSAFEPIGSPEHGIAEYRAEFDCKWYTEDEQIMRAIMEVANKHSGQGWGMRVGEDDADTEEYRYVDLNPGDASLYPQDAIRYVRRVEWSDNW